jgi:hypothetical protein
MQRIVLLTLGLIWLILPLSMARAGDLARQEITATPSPAAETPLAGSPAPAVAILSPGAGQALQGNVTITGHAGGEGFLSAELSFTYTGDSTGTWFLIQEIEQPVADGPLANWDTTTITDGIYDLRLAVHYTSDDQQVMIVKGLRVRNYTPVETITPTPVTPTATPVPGDTAIPTETRAPTITPIPPTGTPLTPNPAQLTGQDILTGMGKGGLAVMGFFALMGIYRVVRDWIKKR